MDNKSNEGRHLDSMDRSLSASRMSSSILGGATTDELSFSVSMIMLLISSWRKESKVKMCPS